MMKILLSLIFLLFSIPSFSKNENVPNIIVFKQNKIDGLSKDEEVNLRKSSLEAILLAKKFELSLADLKNEKLGKDKVWYLFLTSINKNTESEWDMRFELVEQPSGNIINRVTEKRVLKQQLQYRARINSLKLIFGKYVNETTGAIEKNIVIPLDEYVEIKSSGDEKSSHENELKVENPASVSLDFEPEKLVDMKFQEKDNPEKKEDEVDPPKVQKPRINRTESNNPVTISNFTSPNINLEKLPYKPEEIKISKYVKSFSYETGVEKETIESSLVFTSSENVNTDISLSRLMLKFALNSSDDVNGNYLKHAFSFSKNIGDNEYKVGPKLTLGSSYHYEILERRLRLGASGELERSGYANLRSRGEGIQAITSTLLYGGVGMQLIFEISNYNSVLSLNFKRSFWGSSDIADGGNSAMIDGSKIELSLKTTVYELWGISFLAASGNVNSAVSTKLNNKHNMMALYVAYN